MIEVNDLHKSFGKVKVLNGIHLEYHPGKIYGLVGENGAGKTTLFNCIMPPVIGYAVCHSSGLRNRHDISFRA